MTLQELQSEYENYVAYAKEFSKINDEFNSLGINLQNEYDDNIANISSAVKEFEISIVEQRVQSKKEAEKNLDSQKKMIDNMMKSANSMDDKNNLSKMMESLELAHEITLKKIETIDEENKEDFASKPVQIKNAIDKNFEERKAQIISNYEKNYQEYVGMLGKLFANRYETASTNNHLFWENMPELDEQSVTYTIFAVSALKCDLFGKTYNSEIYHLAPLINRDNIVITCDNSSKKSAYELANAMILRNACASPKNLKLNLIDTEGQTHNLGNLRKLDPKIYDKFITDKKDVQDSISYLKNHISTITQKLSSFDSLHDFNLNANVKQNNQLFYFSDFVFDLDEREIGLMDNILKNGPRAGVSSIMIINQEQVELKNDKEDRYKNSIEKIKANAFEINLTESFDVSEFYSDFNNFSLETETKLDVDDFINSINEKIKVQENTLIPFSKYQTEKSKWWKKDSTNGVEIPMGVIINENNTVFNLKYSIDDDNFSSIIVGSSGMGKSSFFHSLINNIMINYGPDEVQFYLIDLMGVEFEPYAKTDLFLPHIKVIASETDREFAVNVIKELREEIGRRVVKYKTVETNNFTSYSNIVGTEKKDPHIFLIVDEFVRIFEENDKISEVIKADLLFMIKMGRKFGIHLVFASQTLKSDSVSFKDVISQMPMRIVFKCLDDDAYELLGSNKNDINKIKRRGQMIFNDQKGKNIKANDLTQVLFIDNTYRDNLLKEISDESKKIFDSDKYEKLVYDINKEAEFKENKLITNISNIADTKEVEVFLGQAINIASQDIYFNFKIDSNSNLSVIGGDVNTSNRIITNAVYSCMFNFKKENAEFHIFNGMNSEDDNYDIPKKYFENINKKNFFYEKVILKDLNVMKARLDNRMTGEEELNTKIFLVFYSFQQFNEFRIEEYKRDSLKTLDYLLSRGSEFGIHIIMQFRDWNSFTNSLGGSSKKVYFAHKVALQMSSTDALMYIGFTEPSKLSNPTKSYSINLGYYNLDGTTHITKFKTYKYPEISWVKEKLSNN